IDAGCTSAGEGVGVDTYDSFARLQNNVIRGVSCATATTANSWAVRVTIGASNNEVDLNGNNLLAMGDPTGTGSTCVALGLLDGGAPGPRGLFRNNILHAGFCPTSYDVQEAAATTLARSFINNDLWYSAAPTALYLAGGTNPLTTLSGVNLYTDPMGNSNLSA